MKRSNTLQYIVFGVLGLAALYYANVGRSPWDKPFGCDRWYGMTPSEQRAAVIRGIATTERPNRACLMENMDEFVATTSKLCIQDPGIDQQTHSIEMVIVARKVCP